MTTSGAASRPSPMSGPPPPRGSHLHRIGMFRDAAALSLSTRVRAWETQTPLLYPRQAAALFLAADGDRGSVETGLATGAATSFSVTFFRPASRKTPAM